MSPAISELHESHDSHMHPIPFSFLDHASLLVYLSELKLVQLSMRKEHVTKSLLRDSSVVPPDPRVPAPNSHHYFSQPASFIVHQDKMSRSRGLQ